MLLSLLLLLLSCSNMTPTPLVSSLALFFRTFVMTAIQQNTKERLPSLLPSLSYIVQPWKKKM